MIVELNCFVDLTLFASVEIKILFIAMWLAFLSDSLEVFSLSDCMAPPEFIPVSIVKCSAIVDSGTTARCTIVHGDLFQSKEHLSPSNPNTRHLCEHVTNYKRLYCCRCFSINGT